MAFLTSAALASLEAGGPIAVHPQLLAAESFPQQLTLML